MNTVICVLCLCGLAYGDVSHLKHNEDNNGYLPPVRGSSISSVPWHSNHEANFQPKPGQIVNYKGMTIQRSKEIHLGNFKEQPLVPKVNKAYENPNEDDYIQESFKGDGYLPPVDKVIPEPQHPNPVTQKIRMPMPSWFQNEVIRNEVASKQTSFGNESNLKSLPENTSPIIPSIKHDISGVQLPPASSGHFIPESFKGDGYLPPSDETVSTPGPLQKLNIPTPSWMRNLVGPTSGSSFGNAVKSKSSQKSNSPIVSSVSHDISALNGNSIPESFKGDGYLPPSDGTAPISQDEQPVLPQKLNILAPNWLTKLRIQGGSPNVENDFKSLDKSHPLPPRNSYQNKEFVSTTLNQVSPPSIPTVFETKPSFISHSTQEHSIPNKKKSFYSSHPSSNALQNIPSTESVKSTSSISSSFVPTARKQQVTIHNHQEVSALIAHSQLKLNLQPDQPLDEIENNEDGYSYEKRVSIPFEEGSKQSIQDQFRTLQIYNKNSKKVSTFKVLEKAEENGLKTIKILGKTNKSPPQENFLRTVQIVGGKNDEPLQTVKIFNDSHEDAKGYLPPEPHYFK